MDLPQVGADRFLHTPSREARELGISGERSSRWEQALAFLDGFQALTPRGKQPIGSFTWGKGGERGTGRLQNPTVEP